MKSLIKLTIKIIFLALLINIANFGQTAGSTSRQDSLQSDSQTSDSVFLMRKSPWGAVLRSAVLPGWGQIYNESYWKAPIVWGIAAWLVYNWIDNNDLYQDYRERYSSTLSSRDQEYRNFYRDQRDLFAIYMGLTYVLTLVDAYVDAHLFDFTVEENLYTRQPMLGIKFKF
ncbi:MAG: DUF5683 domain-containing protein [Ignavibacteriaceae bacterium]